MNREINNEEAEAVVNGEINKVKTSKWNGEIRRRNWKKKCAREVELQKNICFKMR